MFLITDYYSDLQEMNYPWSLGTRATAANGIATWSLADEVVQFTWWQ